MSKARNMARMGQDASAGYTGAFDMPAGTTAERPASAGLGWTRLNTDTGSVEVYDGTNWNAVTRPFISSVTGTIYAGATSNLVIAGQNFTSTITVRFLEGGSTVADVTGVAVSSGSATVAVPAAVYGQTAGDTIEIKVINSDGTMSANGITKTVQALPTGGTITTSGGYRYHTFTSSSNLVVPSGFSATADYLIVAGGGGGGSRYGGGGGAGGYRASTVSLTAQTYGVTVGGGGAGATMSGTNSAGRGSSGSDSSAFGVTSTGGGGGGSADAGPDGASGGSGGGGGVGNYGSGTSGQGNRGGQGYGGVGSYPYKCGGGGGASAAGQDADVNAGYGGDGGAGSTWLNGTQYAGGGGGGSHNPYTGKSFGAGGAGGGGRSGLYGQKNAGIAGTANTGGGGGGASTDSSGDASTVGGAGGSGIVIVRYAL